MDKSRKVVVMVSIKVAKRSDEKMFAARIPELGLTAYGRNEEMARESVKVQFNRFINKYRELGLDLLEKRLNQVGVEWYWEDKYPSDGLPIEYTSIDQPIAPMPQARTDWTQLNDLSLAA